MRRLKVISRASFRKSNDTQLGHRRDAKKCCLEVLGFARFRCRSGVMEGAMSPSIKKSGGTSEKKGLFDAQAFLDSAGVARKVKQFRRAEVVYSQGDAAKSVMD